MLKYAQIFLVLAGLMTNTNANQFTTEQQLASRYNDDIATFWQQGVFSTFNGIKNKRINYAFFNHAGFKHDNSIPNNEVNANKQCLIILSGRSEGYLKYQELSFDLFNLGFNVFLIDHRGQGLSERILSNPSKGYVEDFQYYIDDLATFVDTIVLPHCETSNGTNKPYLLAHSMGGAIAARYLQDHPDSIQAAVLSSPMLGFNSGGIPDVIAKSLVKVTAQINQWVDNTPWYFFGQQDFARNTETFNDFDSNILMHSATRFKQFTDLYLQTPAIQLGGVTVWWLKESIKALDTLFANIDKIKTPTMVIQSGGDQIVSNTAQNKFCQQLHALHPQSCPGGKPIVIEHAFHELFFESDIYREQALSAAIAWFEQHSNTKLSKF